MYKAKSYKFSENISSSVKMCFTILCVRACLCVCVICISFKYMFVISSLSLQDVQFELQYDKANTFIGMPIELQMDVTNTSSAVRTVHGTINVSTMYYTGVLHQVIHTEKLDETQLKGKDSMYSLFSHFIFSYVLPTMIKELDSSNVFLIIDQECTNL